MRGGLFRSAHRQDWKQEWFAEIWHRWQFLYHAGAWDGREALRLIRNCLGAFPDAAWHLVSQETVRNRLRDGARSPWTCLGGLFALLLILAVITSGLPATRQLLDLVWQHKCGSTAIRLAASGYRRDRQRTTGRCGAGLGHAQPAIGERCPIQYQPRAIHFAAEDVARVDSAAPLVIATEASLFNVLQVRPILGIMPTEAGVVLDQQTWRALFHGNPNALGWPVQIGKERFRVAAVLPPGFHFLTRAPSVYLVRPMMIDSRVMIVARARPGATKDKIDRELTKIAEGVTYYFFTSQLRLEFRESAMLAPLVAFGAAVIVSMLIALMVCHIRPRHVRFALRAENRKTAIRRAAFFCEQTDAGVGIRVHCGIGVEPI